jgi:hypothetical protein
MPPREPLESLKEDDLRELLRKVDEAIADGQSLRKKIVDAMDDRKNPVWPEIERRRKPRKVR